MLILTHADAITDSLSEMYNTSQCTEFARIIHVTLHTINNSIDIIHIQGLLLSH